MAKTKGPNLRAVGILATLALVGVMGCADEQVASPFAPTTGGEASRTAESASLPETLAAIERARNAAVAAVGDALTTTPTPTPPSTTTSVSVTYPAGGTIFIGDVVQFEARETLSDGTTRVATTATWGSRNPAVATVSPTGLVTAVAAGQATIFADVNPRGEMRIRVFPDFDGTWSGSERVVSCEDSTSSIGNLCDTFAPRVGSVLPHTSEFAQGGASVDATIRLGFGPSLRTTGTIAVGGQLQLVAAETSELDPFVVRMRNWRSRASGPSRMTGTYELVITHPDLAGSLRIGLRLLDVARVNST